MYAVEVSDQIMIAHSFRGEVFGPAQGVHGATFVIRVAFLAEELDAHGIVVDIARAHDVLKEALVPLNYHNLDELPQFKGINTTTEFLTRHLFDHLADAARKRQARPRRPRAQIDPRHRCGIAGRARLVRGALVVNEVVFAVPGDLANPTGGYAYDRRIIEGLAALGWRTAVVDLGDGFPFPTNEARAAARTRLAALPIGPPIVIDGLAFGALPEAAAALGATHSLVALVHHPLALETGLSAAASASLRASERAALACARHVIATSTTTARLLAADYDVPSERLSVVEPGTERVASPAAPRRKRDRAARGRGGRAAQGLRRAGRRAGAPQAFAMAPCHRR